MNQGINLSVHQGLSQTLSPQMIQSLKLLQLTSLQLEQTIKQELEINPILEEGQELEATEETEISETEQDLDNNDDDGDLKVEEDEIDWDEYLNDGFETEFSGNEDLAKQPKEETFQTVVVSEKTLEDHLLAQLNEIHISETLYPIVKHLIGCLDPNGYLSQPLGEIADDLNVHIVQVEEAVNILQNFDPVGIGARNLQDCLIIQLKHLKLYDTLEMRIVADHFDLLQKIKLVDIANVTGANISDVQKAVKVIGTLNPKPGESLDNKKSQIIIPDLIVEKISGKFVAYLNDSNLPSLRINRGYASLLKKGNTSTKEIKKFVRGKMNSANWLIKAIEQRKATMIKVMNAIISYQYDFFEKGAAFIKPLVMQTVADKIGMHISTISRVANGKYVQTPHGIFELKFFFTSGVEQKDGSEVSAVSATNAIKELVENEDTKKPLSDQKMVELLKDKGINIARRTVAKYRDKLNILPARMRKTY